MKKVLGIIALFAAVALLVSAPASAQGGNQRTSMLGSKPAPTPPPTPDPSYIVGVDDVLTVSVWNEEKVSGDITVRPDGKVTLPGVGNDIQAAGLTVDQLKAKIVEELKSKYFESPDVSLALKTMSSRKVFITGSVAKPGAYLLTGPMTVLQLITMAGGLQEFADKKNITVISATLKNKDGSPQSFKVNYEELMKRKNLARNNIELRPGDQVIVK